MSADLRPGTVLDEKYRIDRRLGKGGMGAVYLATHLGTTRTVALKVIVPHLAGNQEFFVRFQREAEAAGRLRHPNVVNVTDFGVAAEAGGTVAYLVMELLDGQTLAQFLAATPRPALTAVVDIVDQVSLALDAAHAVGIVHRDLKPDNVWLESDRRGGFNVKVLDFGIAKLSEPRALDVGLPLASAVTTLAPAPDAESVPAGDDGPTVVLAASQPTAASPTGLERPSLYSTVAGSIVGTPAYMSPEQCRNEPVDARSDVYALAVITYQMLSGELPFKGATLPATIRMQLAEPPPDLELKVPSLRPGLADAVRLGLEKDRERRPASAGGFALRVRLGAEGEARDLRQAKDLVSVHARLLFGSLLLSLPLPLAGVAAWRAVMIGAASLVRIPPALAIVAGIAVPASLTYFGLQFYEVVAALAMRQFGEHGAYRLHWGRLARDAARLVPRVAATKLRSLTRLLPRHFAADQLWPQVCAVEGFGGRAALERSAVVSAPLRFATLAAVARQLAPSLGSALIFPTTFAMIDEQAFLELARVLTSNSGMGWFVTLYPLLMLATYLAYGPSRYLSYWTARRCLGEAGALELPDAGRRHDGSRARADRGPLLWLAPPVIGLLVCSFGLARLMISDGRVDLQDAVSEGRWATVDRLLLAGAPVDRPDSGGWTPLMRAIDARNVPLAQRLLAAGARADARTRRKVDPLRLAIRRELPELAVELLRRGAPPDTVDEDGRTPLMLAAMRGQAEVVSELVKRGARVSRPGFDGRTARDLAEAEGHTGLAF